MTVRIVLTSCIVVWTIVVLLFLFGHKSTFEPSNNKSAQESLHSETFGPITAHTSASQERNFPDTPSNITEIVSGVRRLEPEDQAGLEQLYKKVRKFIYRHEDRFLSYLNDTMDQIQNVPLTESFFLVRALIAYTTKPTDTVLTILNKEDHPILVFGKPINRLNIVKFYILQEIPKRKEAHESSLLIKQLIRLGKESRDLALVRQSMIALTQLSSNPQTYLEEIAKAREENETFAFSDLIQNI